MAGEETKTPKPDARATYTRQGLEEAGAGFLQALGAGLGQIFDRGRVEVEDLTRTGKAQYDRYQAERQLDALYRRLGREVVREVGTGRIDLPGFEDLLQQIAEGEERVASFEVREEEAGERD